MTGRRGGTERVLRAIGLSSQSAPAVRRVVEGASCAACKSPLRFFYRRLRPDARAVRERAVLDARAASPAARARCAASEADGVGEAADSPERRQARPAQERQRGGRVAADGMEPMTHVMIPAYQAWITIIAVAFAMFRIGFRFGSDVTYRRLRRMATRGHV
jgi:hypothetical protein